MKPLKLPKPAVGASFDGVDPLDGRYYDAQTAQYLSERSRVAYQAYVEGALAQTLAEFKICSKAVADQIEQAAAKVTIEEAYAEELITNHDIKALVNCIKRQINPAAQPYVHFGATSYDIIATATALQLRTAINELVIPCLVDLEKTLLSLTKQYAHTTQIGRTHGQHAVPVTFGFALAAYVSRLGENIEALKDLAAGLRGKFSGAVGAYNALSVFVDDPIKFEKSVLAKLKLKPAPYSSQIVSPEGIVRLIDELAITAGIMANLSHDMRHLQRSEIAEVREHFDKTQTGSSTMAHKRNPKNFENVISLSKQVTAQIINANLNLSSEHQRDLTDSASARFYGVTLATVVSMAKRLNSVMAKIEVDADNMQRNLYLSGGSIAAEPLYLLLEKYGHTQAHEAAKTVSQQAKDNLYEAIKDDKKLQPYVAKFTKEEIRLLRNPEEHYTGLAAKKALMIHKSWQTKFK